MTRKRMMAALWVMSFVGAAHATPNFPGAIQRELGLQSPPQCTICHATNEGGTGTVVKPFGIYLRSRGLVAFDEASLHNALLAAVGEHHDSSGTGVSDIDKLKAGQDPNPTSGGSGTQSVSAPSYGCSTSGGSIAGLLPFAALAAALFTRRSRVGPKCRKLPTPSDGKRHRWRGRRLTLRRTVIFEPAFRP